MLLKVNDIAIFKTYDGKLIKGIVIVVANSCYLIRSDHHCTMYSDGFFRFQDRHMVEKCNE